MKTDEEERRGFEEGNSRGNGALSLSRRKQTGRVEGK
jgi:hypothetical protein